MIIFQGLKLWYDKTKENLIELFIIICVTTIDACLVAFKVKYAADYCCLLRITFVVFMK